MGPPGPRCYMHAGRRYCTVPTCRCIGVQPCLEDDLASAGFRCKEHTFLPHSGGGPGNRNSSAFNQTAECETENCTRPAISKRPDPRHAGRLQAVCKRHMREVCNVETCSTLARGKVKNADSIGLAGPRCGKHGGGWSCSVKGCLNQARANVPEADKWGPPGPRCAFQHGGMRCNIPNCKTLGRTRVAFRDRFGEPGMRCGKHNGNPCNIPGCTSTASGSVKERDKWGPIGQRCTHHGALRCTVLNCQKVGVRKVWFDDNFGGPGLRCKSHNGRRKQPANGLAPKRGRPPLSWNAREVKEKVALANNNNNGGLDGAFGSGEGDDTMEGVGVGLTGEGHTAQGGNSPTCNPTARSSVNPTLVFGLAKKGVHGEEDEEEDRAWYDDDQPKYTI